MFFKTKLFCEKTGHYLIFLQIFLMYAYVAEEGRSILVAFSDNCVNSSLILHQNATCGSFLKGSCNVQSETIFCYIKIHCYV